MEYAKEQVQKQNNWTKYYVYQVFTEFERFILYSTPLEDNYILEHYSVKQDSTITVILKLCGC